MTLTTIQLTVSYDGTSFYGWQKTAYGPSIEEELEKALFRLLGYLPQLCAASRTDRGVHARGQIVHFVAKQPIVLSRLVRGLRALLPSSISILSADFAPPHFHATLSAQGKEYHYFVCNGRTQLPHCRLYSWHVYKALDIKKMNRASQLLLGTHNFSAFSNERAQNPICTLEAIEILSIEPHRFYFSIKGDRFLYKMVRNLVGTLVYVGCGKISEDLSFLLASCDRKQGGITAPAHGLFLAHVFYSSNRAVYDKIATYDFQK